MGIPIQSALGEDGTATVTVLGEIDFSNSDEVAQSIRDTVAAASPPELRVDLAGATFIDSTGLGALIEGYHAATEVGCRFRVTNPSNDFRRVLAVTGLEELFGMPEQEQPAAGLSQASGT
ncbi:STAS domain-containing protein [Actinoplanes sp. N902-109]|uniref:STAS domain-containing protein n=1 Tax=Actinoplanes sp. (strain N902-109) TaxID=649831 RepID=UPI0003295CC5|nr:STAS domain-containing protein [Actinoplanes sp. N902-109]AGL13961.1 anti-sigma-factor antagonist [Actinoplanes sp. N902-109]